MDQIIAWLHSGLNTLIPFIILLGILIFVHEFGHFAVARWCGVRVEVFSLGFGKKIFQFKRGDTVYSISLIPLGGYVKMFGDEIGKDISEEDKAVSFLHKPVAQRIAIVLAGPLMNLFFATLLFWLLAWSGEIRKAPIVGDLKTDTVAFLAGLRPGDKIIEINNQPVPSVEDLPKILLPFIGKTVSVEVERTGFIANPTIELPVTEIDNPNPIALQEKIGHIEGLSFLSFAPIIGVRGGTMAEKLGLRTGDKIESINGYTLTYFRQIESKLMTLQGQITHWKVTRTGETGKVESLELSFTVPPENATSLSSFGIEVPELYLGQVIPGTPADRAGLKKYDRLLSLNNKPLKTWEDVLDIIKNYQEPNPLMVELERNGERLTVAIQPEEKELLSVTGKSENRKIIGIATLVQMVGPETIKWSYSGWSSVSRSIYRAYEVSMMTVLSFVRLIERRISPKTIGGVLSIGQVASESFQMGWEYFLNMMAVISINLFVLNLLPVPVLDGGHLLFFTLEAIRGAPLSMRKMEIAQQIGLALLLGLMSFALFNDFSRIFGF